MITISKHIINLAALLHIIIIVVVDTSRGWDGLYA